MPIRDSCLIGCFWCRCDDVCPAGMRECPVSMRKGVSGLHTQPYMFGKRSKRMQQKKKPETRHGRMFREAFRSEREVRVHKRLEERAGRGLPWWAWLLWVVFLGAIIYTIFFSPFHALGDLSVSGNRDIPVERIEHFIREEWSKPLLAVFPGNNFFLFHTGRMEALLLHRFPKLETVEMRKTFPNRLSVVVSERERILLFCVSEDCFLVDDDGRAADVTDAIRVENESFLVRVEGMSGVETETGTILFDPGFSDIALRLERGLREELELPVVFPIMMPSRVSGELRFRMQAGWEVYTSSDILPEKTLATLRLVLEEELPEEKRERLRYIDLRTENRAFYAFEEESKEDENEDEEGEEKRRESADNESEEVDDEPDETED